MKYIKRVIDKTIDIYAKAFGAIQLKGPKGCGKSRTARERSKTEIAFEDPEKRKNLLEIANINPKSFLKYEMPILFDEWQDAPTIWDMLRYECDINRHFGSFYLTGSSSKNVETSHTGTGRIATIEMLPMSLYETKESNGLISLKELFNNPALNIDGLRSNLTIDDLKFAICRGGWPLSLDVYDKDSQLTIALSYFNQIVSTDISKIDGVKKDKSLAIKILQSYARNIGTLVKKKTIYQDVQSTMNYSADTIDSYIDKLKELYIIEDISAWFPQIRSRKSLRMSKKRMFIDPSIACAALGLNPDYFDTDYDLLGHIFESLVFRDLKVYSSAINGEMSHYHDAFDLEVDGVLHLRDGRYALIEIKLGGKGIDDGIKNLKKVKELIIEANRKNEVQIRVPDLMMIIYAGEFAYTKDDIKIIPIGCLKD